MGAHLSHLSCNASAALQHFVVLGLVEEVFEHEAYKDREAVWKWEGEECPDEGGERLEKFRVVTVEQLSTNGIACKVKYRHHTSQTSLLSPCFGDSLSTNLRLKICDNLGRKISGFHGLRLLFSMVSSILNGEVCA